MADMNYAGAQEGYALDFLNAQGPSASFDEGDSQTPGDTSDLSGNESEDPVARGQSPAADIPQFVPYKPTVPPRRVKQGGTPSGRIPNLTRGARRIP